MKKNVAGQKIGAQMVDASTGAAFTSAVTVYVTGDAGTQAIGSVGSGACTHEGNGYHTYAPAQAETNYDLVAFTFIGSGAVPATVQVFTSFPQSGDAYAEAVTLPDAAAVATAVWGETFTLPGQVAPSNTPTAEDALGFLYKSTRNKVESTSTETRIYNDAGTTVDHKAAISDDGTTFTRAEFSAGP